VTGAGGARLQKALPCWRAAQDRVSAVLGPREAALIELLGEVETRV
jgi:hypothetical protein